MATLRYSLREKIFRRLEAKGLKQVSVIEQDAGGFIVRWNDDNGEHTQTLNGVISKAKLDALAEGS